MSISVVLTVDILMISGSRNRCQFLQNFHLRASVEELTRYSSAILHRRNTVASQIRHLTALLKGENPSMASPGNILMKIVTGQLPNFLRTPVSPINPMPSRSIVVGSGTTIDPMP